MLLKMRLGCLSVWGRSKVAPRLLVPAPPHPLVVSPLAGGHRGPQGAGTPGWGAVGPSPARKSKAKSPPRGSPHQAIVGSSLLRYAPNSERFSWVLHPNRRQGGGGGAGAVGRAAVPTPAFHPAGERGCGDMGGSPRVGEHPFPAGSLLPFPRELRQRGTPRPVLPVCRFPGQGRIPAVPAGLSHSRPCPCGLPRRPRTSQPLGFFLCV